jgi:hypothetical protein
MPGAIERTRGEPKDMQRAKVCPHVQAGTLVTHQNACVSPV